MIFLVLPTQIKLDIKGTQFTVVRKKHTQMTPDKCFEYVLVWIHHERKAPNDAKIKSEN